MNFAFKRVKLLGTILFAPIPTQASNCSSVPILFLALSNYDYHSRARWDADSLQVSFPVKLKQDVTCPGINTELEVTH
jgi:hypothetical protein